MLYSELFSRSLELPAGKDKALDIQLLIEAAFGLTRTQFWIKKNEEITDSTALNRFYRCRRRLLKNEPTAYILGKKEFYGETFYVDKNVLIPRPETEILVEKAVELIKAPAQLLDIGSGSGIIAIMMAKLTDSTVTAVEISPGAMRVLKKNIALHQVENNVIPICADLFPLPGKRFRLILSNPPYIPETEWRELESTVKDYEPKTALTAPDNGLEIIGRIAEKSGDYLVPGGKILMEIGYNQQQQVEKILKETGFEDIEFIKDYSDIPRIVSATLKACE